MANIFYYEAGQELLKAGIDAQTANSPKVALVTASYTPNASTHTAFDDITNEVVGDGYTAGGKALTTTISMDGAVVKLDAGNLEWTAADFTARAAVVYIDSGTPSTSPLLCYIDFGENKTADGGTFDLIWHPDGIIRINLAQ